MSLDTIITDLRTELARMNDVADGFQAVKELFQFSSYTPTLAAGGSMTFTSTTITVASYMRVNKLGLIDVQISGTTGGSAHPDLTFTLPSGWSHADTNGTRGFVRINDGGGVGGEFLPSSGIIVVRNLTGANWGIGAGRSYRGLVILRLA